MRRLSGTAIALVAACGGGAPQGPAMHDPPPQPISIEWKVEDAGDHRVDVTLVVDGRAHAIGALDATTDMHAGTSTCALRAAGPRRTELVCGDGNAYAAQLADGELVVTFVAPGAGAEPRTEVKRLPVYGDVLAIKMLALPIDP